MSSVNETKKELKKATQTIGKAKKALNSAMSSAKTTTFVFSMLPEIDPDKSTITEEQQKKFAELYQSLETNEKEFDTFLDEYQQAVNHYVDLVKAYKKETLGKSKETLSSYMD